MARFRRLSWLIVALFMIIIPQHSPPSYVNAQVDNLITLEIVQAGFGGLYRPDDWFPVRVRVINRGIDFSGRVVVRPETSSGLRDTYSVPITDLARPIAPTTETIATTFLYLIAHGGDINLRVELLDDDGNAVAGANASLRAVNARNSLYVVIPPTSNLNLSTASPANLVAHEAAWTIADIPDREGSLSAVDAMILNDVDTGNLTPRQIQTIQAWVRMGGHFIVTGGDSIGATAGLADLITFTPQATLQVDGFDQLVALAGRNRETLRGASLITTGSVHDDGRILAQTNDGHPLIIRREVGYGTVDFLTYNPTLAPFSQWFGQRDLWFTLLTSTQPLPSWTGGFRQWNNAQNAVEILPGINLLPSAWSLILFLGAYILLIGPLNYLILSRFNRRGYAWLTIPLFIGLFSVLAYTVGFELRGNVVTLSRLSIVQTWPNQEEAHVEQIIGLLAPQRGDYTLTVQDNRLLRPIGRTSGFNVINNQIDNVQIQQGNAFSAIDFPVDASFLAGFSTSGTLSSPAISGVVTVASDEFNNASLRGFVRNDSGIVLESPFIMTAGSVYPLGATLTDGIHNFEMYLSSVTVREPAAPSPLEVARRGSSTTTGIPTTRSGSQRSYPPANITSIISAMDATFTPQSDEELQERERRITFLRAFMEDQYFSTGRGNRVFLVGWATSPILNETVPNEQIQTIDTTLYIIELESLHLAENDRRTITQDYFTWVAIERDSPLNFGPVNLENQGDLTLGFRFTPMPNAILEHVERLSIVLDRGFSSAVGGTIELWNWSTGQWETRRFNTTMRIDIDDPAPYLSPLNAVQIRTIPRTVEGITNIGTPTVTRIGIEQTGR